MSAEISFVEFRWVFLTLLLTIFSCWSLQELLERRCKMAPNIAASSSISYSSMNRKMTKSLDARGRFRIQTRGTIYFIKALHELILFIASILIFSFYPEWFMNHFINYEPETVYFLPYLHINASLVGYYGWEVSANRYGKLTYPVLIHHWFTAGIATCILFGCYTPFATWYGFTTISMSFPVFTILGFRAQYSNKYPQFTRKSFRFAYYYFLWVLIINLSGQIYMIINSYYQESIHYPLLIIMLLCIAAWLYDDIKILRCLREFATHDYEDADILNNTELAPILGGRSIYGLDTVHNTSNISILPQLLSTKRKGKRSKLGRMN